MRAHLLRDATRGRRFRRGSKLRGLACGDCRKIERRPTMRRRVACRSRAQASSTARAEASAQLLVHLVQVGRS